VLTVFSEVVANFGPWRPMIIALVIIGVMLAYPSGLVGLVRAAWGATIGRLSREAPGLAAPR
jgi:branched-chain amino acid transport system permease protein